MTQPSIPQDEMRALGRGLASAGKALDRDIAASGALSRVAMAVRLRVAARPVRRAAWLAIAATLLLAACLGSIVDLAILAPQEGVPQDLVVVLDPLVFGPTELDVR